MAGWCAYDQWFVVRAHKFLGLCIRSSVWLVGVHMISGLWLVRIIFLVYAYDQAFVVCGWCAYDQVLVCIQ